MEIRETTETAKMGAGETWRLFVWLNSHTLRFPCGEKITYTLVVTYRT